MFSNLFPYSFLFYYITVITNNLLLIFLDLCNILKYDFLKCNIDSSNKLPIESLNILLYLS